MKKFVSIPLIVLVLFTGITVNMAAHYCGGSYVASKISLSGELATCGMEHQRHEKPGINEQDHSCQDFTSSYTFSSNYVPSTVQVVDNIHLFEVADLSFFDFLFNEPQSTVPANIVRPPGVWVAGRVNPEVICIFRI